MEAGRRTLIAGFVGAAMWPLAAQAQQKVMPVVGYMSSRSLEDSALLIAAFRQGLAEAGFVEGRNLSIEYRWAEGDYDRLPALAADLAGRKVDVIVTNSNVAARAAKAASQTIPIVAAFAGDPVVDGLIDSLGRPGGNVTGVSFLAEELNPKLFELLRELVPQARVIALLVNSGNPNTERIIRYAQEVARPNGVQLQILRASSENEIDAAFADLAERQAGALVVGADAFFNSRRNQIVALATRHVVSTIYGFREYAMAGGLISYGSNFTVVFRQLGIYAGRILNGAKPADLPVVQPTTVELIVNLKAAKALGLTIPPSILARADEVIE